jgi:hypothetical protein
MWSIGSTARGLWERKQGLAWARGIHPRPPDAVRRGAFIGVRDARGGYVAQQTRSGPQYPAVSLSAIFTLTLAQRPEWLAPRLGAEQRTGTMLLGMGAARHQNTPFVTPQETALHSFSGACPQGMDSPDARDPQSIRAET